MQESIYSEENDKSMLKEVEELIRKKGLLKIHKSLPVILAAFEKNHLIMHKNSKLKNELKIINHYLNKIAHLDEDDDAGVSLVYLTSIAKKLQEFQAYKCMELSELGQLLLQKIELFRQEISSTYLCCNITEENNLSYTLSNTFNLLGKAGPFAVSSASAIDGIVAPFYQEEYKLFNLVSIGAKNKLGRHNKGFSEKRLEQENEVQREIHRYRLQRLSKTHRDHTINVFEASYQTEDVKTSDNETIYMIGIHGNAYNASGMLQYLDEQAFSYLAQNSNAKVVAIAPDYPGSAASGGKYSSMDELATDSVVIVIKHLIKRGVSPSQILTIGHSLGGAVLVTGLNQLQKEGIITTAISINSFSQIQKFVGNSSIIGTMFVNHYNNDVSDYFQQLPKNRRHVRHTEDDQVISLEKSLLKSLKANQIDIEEGVLLSHGGHDLNVHTLDSYVDNVAKDLKANRQNDDLMNFKKICDIVDPIINEQKVAKTKFIIASTFEDDDVEDKTQLGKIKKEYNSLCEQLKHSDVSKSQILLGFLVKTLSTISGLLEKDANARAFSLFNPRSAELDALDELKIKIEKNLLQHENIGDLFINSESLLHCQKVYEMQIRESKNSITLE